jgi:hypothetical protein
MLNLRAAANVDDSASFSNRLRSRRLDLFEGLISAWQRPVRIIDIGGTSAFWEQRGWGGRSDVRITTVNLSAESKRFTNVDSVAGDATNLEAVADGAFDVAFSNSVIEHLFTYENQQKMAGEMRRVAKAYWVQTPNFWFPVEPHFHVPGWQWLPIAARTAVIRRFRCGWRGPCPDPVAARRLVEEVRLLTGTQLRALFPDGMVWHERVLGVTKSFVVYGGFDKPTRSAESRTSRQLVGTSNV